MRKKCRFQRQIWKPLPVLFFEDLATCSHHMWFQIVLIYNLQFHFSCGQRSFFSEPLCKVVLHTCSQHLVANMKRDASPEDTPLPTRLATHGQKLFDDIYIYIFINISIYSFLYFFVQSIHIDEPMVCQQHRVNKLSTTDVPGRLKRPRSEIPQVLVSCCWCCHENQLQWKTVLFNGKTRWFLSLIVWPQVF